MFRSKTPDPVQTVAKPPPVQESRPESRQPKMVPVVTEPAERPAAPKPVVQQESKADPKFVPIPVDKPVSQPAKAAAAEPRPAEKGLNRSESKAEKPAVKADVKTGNTEIKLAINPESVSKSRSESGSSKGEAKDKVAASSPKAAPPPPEPQPKKEEQEESYLHPLPDALPPKLREPEMDLTFYKSLATKKMILPEEPTGKRVIPPFLAAATPTASSGKKDYTPVLPEKSAPSKPAPEARKPEAEAVKPSTDSKAPAVEPKKAAAERKKASTEPKKQADESQKAADEADKSAEEATKKKSYQVQVAILSDMKRATDLADQLRGRGAVNPRVSTVKYSSGRVLFRVRLGPFSSQSEAAKSAQRWQAAGQSALIFVDD
ncbi:MAG: SPOR domain-containing protein [Magnetococcales bacterium]|nr:SPOR domain-containing protein [Magnetococcales bacterium]